MDMENDGVADYVRSLSPWQLTVQQLRFMNRSPSGIIQSITKYFKGVSPVDIEEFMDNNPKPSGFITSKNSTVTAEDIVDCVHTLSIELSSINDGRGLLLGCYLYLIKECNQSKVKELNKIGKTHLDLFKKLDL